MRWIFNAEGEEVALRVAARQRTAPLRVGDMCTCGIEKSNMASVFHETIESRLELLHRATQRVVRLIRAMPPALSDLDDLRLVLSEAIANAIIHGNREDRAKEVTICGGLDHGDGLLLVITDQGAGFDPTSVPDPTSDQNILATHGRGMFLIKHFMDQVEFRLGGRQLVLRKRLAPSRRVA